MLLSDTSYEGTDLMRRHRTLTTLLGRLCEDPGKAWDSARELESIISISFDTNDCLGIRRTNTKLEAVRRCNAFRDLIRHIICRQ